MGSSIPEKLKKINSSLTAGVLLSLGCTVLCLALFLGIINHTAEKARKDVVYRKGEALEKEQIPLDSRPFASNKGTTYTFTWCKGSSKILSKNRIYFQNEQEAQMTGRTLSKECL